MLAALHRIGAKPANQQVVTAAAAQHVFTVEASKHIGGVVTGNDVVQIIAGALDGGTAGQEQPLDVGGQRVADGLRTVSKPASASSMTTSPALSTK